VGVFRRLTNAVKGAVWLVRPQGLRHQLDYLENQLDGVHTLFDHWQERFNELFARFERQAQAVLPDVLEKQQQLGDKLSQLNAGFGAREARLTKWLMELEQNGRELLEEMKSHQEQIAKLQTALREQASRGRDMVNHEAEPAEPEVTTSADTTSSRPA
jgi:hypothetical protein